MTLDTRYPNLPGARHTPVGVKSWVLAFVLLDTGALLAGYAFYKLSKYSPEATPSWALPTFGGGGLLFVVGLVLLFRAATLYAHQRSLPKDEQGMKRSSRAKGPHIPVDWSKR